MGVSEVMNEIQKSAIAGSADGFIAFHRNCGWEHW
jgi:hypothetical protein